MAENADNGYTAYPVFKGLQKPLEFLGIQGRYIYWAAGTAGGAIVGFIIGYCVAVRAMIFFLIVVVVIWFILSLCNGSAVFILNSNDRK